ncbi:hypothetical protein MPTK1_4g22400 [Marchantia polymorpha subsp. ruderalis]|uniref:Uncharacterized protein n=2 Tax=Marchantia polymorpha TaxID=3197 RepID=A0AAF6BCM2_MARPO|nr:hypothetical protein MARPO_0020s0010 [Marchantia polymorpha]BBN09756.1 hypothetical protein Mp_4g22400 [Marchantia polymorpha subsp. ruderalis]|eukprot:PTQ44338.1 hypothetical protein MARPO_0020s0010 [Marchantia polymorpha]
MLSKMMVDFRRGGGRSLLFVAASFLLVLTGQALSILDVDGVPAYASKVVSEAAEAVVKQSGLKKEAIKISSVNMKDAKLGETVLYEFDIQVGDSVLPFMVREEITAWRFLEEVMASYDKDKGGNPVDVWNPEFMPAVMKPFQLAGPVDLWISDAKDLRLAMPHEVDAGMVRRVLVADGAFVTVEGAREVSLSHPLQLPLPLLQTGSGFGGSVASKLLHLAARLRQASQSEEKPLLSLRIVGPTSLVAASEESDSNKAAGLKVKKLAPGSVELVSRKDKPEQQHLALVQDQPLSLTVPWLWPLASLNGSNPNLLGLEKALLAVLGRKAHQRGSINLLKAKATVASFVKLPFELEMQLNNETVEDYETRWPEWITKPKVQRWPFEILAKVEGDKLLAMNVNQLEDVQPIEVSAWDFQLPYNRSDSKFSPFLGEIRPMTLEMDWDGF